MTFVSSYTGPTPTVTHIFAGAASGTVPGMTISCAGVSHRGKAPPVDAYTGENVEVRFEDWLPILDCAVSRNAWTDEESLIQHAGHWRGRAPQEWNLLGEEKKGTSNGHTSPAHTIRSREQGFSGPGLSTSGAEGWQVSS